MSRERERDIQQRSFGCFGLSAILHAALGALILFAPNLQLFENPAGAQEAQGSGSGGFNATTIELVETSGGNSQPKAEPAKAEPVVASAANEPAKPNDVVVAAPSKVEKAEAPPVQPPPTAAPVAAPAPAKVAATKAPEPEVKPKAEPVAARPKAELPKQARVAPAPKNPRSSSSKAEPKENGDIEAALLAARASDKQTPERKSEPKSEPKADTQKQEPVAKESADEDAKPTRIRAKADLPVQKESTQNEEAEEAAAASAVAREDAANKSTAEREAEAKPTPVTVAAVSRPRANKQNNLMNARRSSVAEDETGAVSADSADSEPSAAAIPARKTQPRNTAPANTGRGEGQGEAPATAAAGQRAANDGKVVGLAAGATAGGAKGSDSVTAGAPTGVRDAADLREAPGNPKPVYPYDDRLNHREGTVVFLALVNADGSLARIQLEKGANSSSLDQSAIAAFRRHRYQPGQQGWIRKAFTFSLSGEVEEVPARLRQ